MNQRTATTPDLVARGGRSELVDPVSCAVTARAEKRKVRCFVVSALRTEGDVMHFRSGAELAIETRFPEVLETEPAEGVGVFDALGWAWVAHSGLWQHRQCVCSTSGLPSLRASLS